MKVTFLVSILILFFPILLLSAELKLGKNTLSYNLSEEWRFFDLDSTEGTKSILFKRNHITDRNKIDVIPNLGIEIIKVIPGEINKSSDENNQLDMMTFTLLLDKAPAEVLKEYKDSKDDTLKYTIPYKPSYGFVSNYVDNFGENHDCYYITLLKKDEVGVFIIIDCTQEIFPHIDKEIQDFLNSLSIN